MRAISIVSKKCEVTCDGLENVFGCRARHSLQVFNLRHWSGWRGVGEQEDCPVKQPILRERGDCLLIMHKAKMQAVLIISVVLPLCTVRRCTGPSAPHTTSCCSVAGLWWRHQGTGVRGNRQGYESPQCDAIEAAWQKELAIPARHCKWHWTIYWISHSWNWGKRVKLLGPEK